MTDRDDFSQGRHASREDRGARAHQDASALPSLEPGERDDSKALFTHPRSGYGVPPAGAPPVAPRPAAPPAPAPPRGAGYSDETRPLFLGELAAQQQSFRHRQNGGTPPPGPGQPAPGPLAGGWNYVEGVPHQPAPPRPPAPRQGWRRAVYRATFGWVNLGPSPAEQREAALMAAARTPLRGHYRIGVLGKGGTGKTTVSASVGSFLAELRPDDRVVAVDADTAFGKLGARVDPRAAGSYWELANDEHLDTFAAVRNRVGNNAAGLFVLAGEPVTARRRRVLDAAVYREATSRLDRHFTIMIVDCGSTLDSPVTAEALRDLDALIVVTSPWADGASAATQTMEWLADRGMGSLLTRTVVVLNDSDGHADKRTRAALAHQFASHGQQVFEVPFDPHLRPGGVIDVDHELSAKARLAFLQITAAVAQGFAPAGGPARRA